MTSNATQAWAKRQARALAEVWLLAYQESRNVTLDQGLGDRDVSHCARLVADEVFNLHMQRVEDGEVDLPGDDHTAA